MTSGKRDVSREQPDAMIGVYRVVAPAGKNQDGKLMLNVVCTSCGATQTMRKSDMLSAERRGSLKCRTCSTLESETPSNILSDMRVTIYKRAKIAKRGLACDLSTAQMRELFAAQGGKCAYTGRQLAFRPEKTASLDRINSDVGYTAGNVQWVHKAINVAKHTQTHEEFIAMCYAVVSHHLDALDPATKEQYKSMLFPVDTPPTAS